MAMAISSLSYSTIARTLKFLPALRCYGSSPSSLPQVSAGEWGGLQAWRSLPVDKRRKWGNLGPDEDGEEENVAMETAARGSSLAEWGAIILNTPCPALKASLTHRAFRLWSAGELPLGVAFAPNCPARLPKPLLVPPKEVPLPKSAPLPPNAYIIHNLAHVELNAIDLAWDTVVRFSAASEELDLQFFVDFARVADDESRHLSWCLQRLSELGACYGDMPAHNLLLDSCQQTSGSVMARLAVVPMVQEARGLDAGPRLADRLVGMGDNRSAGIVKQIANEELAHVAVGVSWFTHACKKLGKDPEITFKNLMVECNVELKGPFNHSARAEAGIPRHWYDASNSSIVVPRGHRKKQQKDCNSNIELATSSTKSNVCDNKDAAFLPQVCERLGMLVAMEVENSAS